MSQPDLNYRNPVLVEEMKNVLRFWLDKGIAGFRIDAINHLFEADKALYGGKFPDEPRSGYLDAEPLTYGYHDHIYTKDQDETYDMIYQWREVFDEYKAKDGFTRVMMTEAYASPQNIMRYFRDGDREGVQMPFNFALITDVNGGSTAYEIKSAVDKFINFKPLDMPANWVVSNREYFIKEQIV
jgi:alpha-glucosidase